MSNNPMINDALKLLRLYCGLSQVQIASKIGVSQSLISDIEASRKKVTLDVLERYSKSLGIRMSQLLFFAEEIEGQPVKSKGQLLVADKVLKLLQKIKPNES